MPGTLEAPHNPTHQTPSSGAWVAFDLAHANNAEVNYLLQFVGEASTGGIPEHYITELLREAQNRD